MSILICPNCKGRLEQNDRSFSCKRGHNFDLSASGYLHLLPSSQMRSKIPGDNKQMVKARKDFLATGYYQPISDMLNQEVMKHCKKVSPLQVVDAGCGEGYYTNRLAKALQQSGMEFEVTGLDISKFAVDAAAKAAKKENLADKIQYAVASVFELPVKDHSCHVVTNLFAPVCIEEYRRVLKHGGILVFAVSSTKHLWELKESIYDEAYENEKFDHVYEGFKMIGKEKVTQMISLKNQEEIDNLFTMTPYYYKSSVETAEKLHSLGSLDTQIDVDIITYMAI